MSSNVINYPTMQNFKAIFFDFDGTIADTVNGILATMTATFKELNLPIPPQDAMKSTIGMLLGDALQQLGNLDDSQRVLAVKTYQRLFREVELPNTRIFPGVSQTLQKARARYGQLSPPKNEPRAFGCACGRRHHLRHRYGHRRRLQDLRRHVWQPQRRTAQSVEVRLDGGEV